MGDFKQRDGGFKRGGDRGGFGGRPKFGGRPGGNRDFGPREMFSATCAECGKPCEVPFRPNGEKPVYCNVCFGKNKPNQSGVGQNFSRNDFKPTPQAPGGQSFGGTVKIDGAQMGEIRDQLQNLNAKIEKLIAAINPKAEKSSIAVEKSAPASSVAKKSAKKLASKKK